MEINSLLFRCSSLGYLMANDRSGKSMGESAKTHLVDCFVSWMYGRREQAEGKFLDKGNQREEDSVTLVSRLNKRFFKKNGIRLNNEYITGEPDLFTGELISNAEETIDAKTSWSAHTFFRAQKAKLDDKYFWQGMGYVWLTGAKKHTVAYCLVNGTAQAILDEKRKAAYRFGPDPDAAPEYIEKCKQIEVNHIFDLFSFKEENPWFEFHSDLSDWTYDIPMDKRLFTFTFDRDEEAINMIRQRVIEGRKWIEANLLTGVPVV